jgi:hypothetical protein
VVEGGVGRLGGDVVRFLPGRETGIVYIYDVSIGTNRSVL